MAARVARYLAGHTGLVGSALRRRWENEPSVRLLTATHAQLDLTEPEAVRVWLQTYHPDEVVVAAGRVGGIAANAADPVMFLFENLMIEAHLIRGAWEAGVKRLLNFGSACMYPRECAQPMRPEHLMTGPMEPTSEAYAMAKWVGLAMCRSYRRQYGARFITAIPCTVYGPGDHFDVGTAHVLPALIRKMHEADLRDDAAVTLWGRGTARREFVYADDLAEACEVLLACYDEEAPINIGSGQACTIRELAELVAEVVGFQGDIRWDDSKPDGAPEKRLDASAIHRLGWGASTSLRDGVVQTYQWFVEHEAVQAGKVSCASS